MIFTIDTDNSITAHTVAPAADDGVDVFASRRELARVVATWPFARLIEVWNSFAGVPPFGDLKPVKKFTDRKTAVGRIWKAIQKLEATPAPPRWSAASKGAAPAPHAAPKPPRKVRTRKTATPAAVAPQARAAASTLPRGVSKHAIVSGMLVRPGGATLEEIMVATGWQKHTCRGFISTLAKKTGKAITSSRRESDKARVYEAAR